MTEFGFPVLVFISCMLFQCEGVITSPAEGTEFVFLPRSTGKLTWTFNDGISSVSFRAWFFTHSGGSTSERLATIADDDDPKIRKSNLSGIEIVKPATLLLKKVNQSYDGIYRFQLSGSSPVAVTIGVRVYIAKKPTVTINCSSSIPITLNEGDEVTCVCIGEGGNPPANVTWFKNGDKITETATKNQTLTLNNVNETARGNYTCVAESYPNPGYKDNKTIIVQVNFKPKETSITILPKSAKLGNSVTIKCDSRGFPPPNYTIILNGTETVSFREMHIISKMMWNDTGTYNCTASNAFGSDWDSEFLNVTTETGPTTSPNATSNTTSTPTSRSSPSGKVTPSDDADDDDGVNIGLIVGIVIGVLVLILIIGVVVYYYKSKEKDGRNRGDIDPVAGNHYELENEPGPGDNAYDTVGPVGESSSKKKAPEKNPLPPVYAAVDKNNRQGNTLYASLDTDAMKPKRESRKEPERTPQTEYASIDFAKSPEVPKADLV